MMGMTVMLVCAVCHVRGLLDDARDQRFVGLHAAEAGDEPHRVLEVVDHRLVAQQEHVRVRAVREPFWFVFRV